MEKIKYLLYGFTVLLMAAKSNGQDTGPVQDTLQICYNGNFELGMGDEYAFKTGSSNTDIDCDFDTSGFVPEIIGGPSGNVAIVSSYNEPVLSALSPTVIVSTVNTGSYAIKLNNDFADSGATTMLKTINTLGDGNNKFVTFNYSLIIKANSLLDDTNVGRFIVRAYNSGGNSIGEFCVDPIDDNCLFTISDSIYYTGWRCHTIYFNEELLSDPSLLEFTIIDGGNSGDFSTVYIDDICNKEACENEECGEGPYCIPTLELHDDVASGTDEREVSEWIKAYNTIESGATAIYHAGELVNDVLIGGEIVLLPKTTEDPIGFECLAGSIGHFYIKECPGSFEARHAMTKPEEPVIKPNPTATLQIFPNPTNSELNILSDAAVRSVRMVSLDGKLVLERQPGADDNKNIRLDVSNLSSGIYILNVETANGTVTTHKIVRE